jgi:hypothetical protein
MGYYEDRNTIISRHVTPLINYIMRSNQFMRVFSDYNGIGIIVAPKSKFSARSIITLTYKVILSLSINVNDKNKQRFLKKIIFFFVRFNKIF